MPSYPRPQSRDGGEGADGGVAVAHVRDDPEIGVPFPTEVRLATRSTVNLVLFVDPRGHVGSVSEASIRRRGGSSRRRGGSSAESVDGGDDLDLDERG